jgi:hypothetical protein
MMEFAAPVEISMRPESGRNFAFIYGGAFLLAKNLVAEPATYASVSDLLWHFGNSISRERDRFA